MNEEIICEATMIGGTVYCSCGEKFPSWDDWLTHAQAKRNAQQEVKP